MSQSLHEFLAFLHTKGFKLGEDAKGFILFGQHYTGADDSLAIAALEVTLKAQKQFDGSFFISFLEVLVKEGAYTKKAAIEKAKALQIL
ncbi:hypothetical protein GJU40_01940 [Bacillus lacus]|uniref:Group-specific protein n=1 Tax=Metabacillus lacus TaxID=1983721 RepID=A0A7X2LXP2_9BACI|nr:DUF6123 family protein [Metabacillus lacus]MRX70928.1 hypothetical protein [Metabacillus lacus]